MKTLRILARVGVVLFVVWGLVALFHTSVRQPGQRPFLFWFVLPYPVLLVLTALVISTCARNSRSGEAGFSWFAVGLGAMASIGLAAAVSTGLFSIISWAYVGHVTLTSAGSTDPTLIAINIAVIGACCIWSGAISAALSPKRPLPHAIAAGAVLLLWFSAVTLVAQPVVISLLLVALTLPIPFAAWGARLQQARMTTLRADETC